MGRARRERGYVMGKIGRGVRRVAVATTMTAVLVGGTVIATEAPAAAAPPTGGFVDQAQTIVDQGQRLPFRGTVTQTFTAGVTGLMTGLDLWITHTLDAADSGQDLSVSIEALGGGGGVPSFTQLAAAQLPDALQPVLVSIPLALSVVAGRQYSIAVNAGAGLCTDRIYACGSGVDEYLVGVANPRPDGTPVYRRGAGNLAFRTRVAPATRLDASVVQLFPPGISLPLSARLSALSTNQPVAGQAVTFSTGSGPICTGVTNSFGVATCGGLGGTFAAIGAGGFTARFLGDVNHLGSTGQGGLIG